MQIVVNNFHNDDLSWLPKGEVFIYDHKEQNFGYNIHDYMDWTVKNYDNLDDMVLFTKGNMLKRHITPEEWDKIKDNKTLTPILTQGHHTYLPICFYSEGLFNEVNDYWYLAEHQPRNIRNFSELIDLIGMREKSYNAFAPGGCYLVPKENILKHPKEFYEKLLNHVNYTEFPGEAFIIERGLYNIWL